MYSMAGTFGRVSRRRRPTSAPNRPGATPAMGTKISQVSQMALKGHDGYQTVRLVAMYLYMGL